MTFALSRGSLSVAVDAAVLDEDEELVEDAPDAAVGL